jgi:phenylpropionate dioxygenase-like ring-hydroxylating dioxygenase large terminal subunit
MKHQVFACFTIICGTIALVGQPQEAIAAISNTHIATPPINTIAKGRFIPRGGSFKVKAAKTIVLKGGGALTKALKGYKTQKFRLGDRRLVQDRGDISRIMKNHHPKFYNPEKKTKQLETMMPKKWTHRDVSRATAAIIKQNRKNGSKIGSILTGTYRGKKIEVGYNRDTNGRLKNHLNHFVPKLGKK